GIYYCVSTDKENCSYPLRATEIALPHLSPCDADRREIQGVVEHREAGRRGIARRVDVLHQNRVAWRAVGLPQLEAGAAVVGREIQLVVEHREAGIARRVDVLHQNRVARRAVGLPQLEAGAA